MQTLRSLHRAALAAICALPLLGTAQADDIPYPVNSVRIVVPANPGGGTDTAARLFADFMSRYTGKNIAIINQFAGGGVVAAQTVATGRPNGSELLLYHTSIHVAEMTGTWPIGYKDLTPLATVSLFDDVVVALPDAPFDTLDQYMAYSKEHPGDATFGSQIGGTTEIKGNALRAASGDTLRVVDAGSESDRTTALLGEQVDAIPMGVSNARQYVEAGQVKVLAVLNDDPNPFVPDWPTAKSQGVDISFPLVFQLYGPPGMDPEAIKAIDAVVDRMKTDDAVKAAYDQAQQVLTLRDSAETLPYLEQERAFVESQMR